MTMTVRDLIRKLAEMPLDLPVVIYSESDEKYLAIPSDMDIDCVERSDGVFYHVHYVEHYSPSELGMFCEDGVDDEAADSGGVERVLKEDFGDFVEIRT